MKLRLLVTEECNLNCPKCCNKQYNLNEVPKCDWQVKYIEWQDSCPIPDNEIFKKF